MCSLRFTLLAFAILLSNSRVISVAFVVYVAKVRRKKLKKNLFAIVFLISFAMRVRWVPVVVAPALVLLLWWSLVFGGGRSGRCVPAPFASCAILLTSAK